jgi:urease accessory protein
VAAAVIAVILAGAAEAHTLGAAAAGFSAGLAHPLVGLDHLLAMVAVGLWAVQLAERSRRVAALWLVPGAFVLMMAAGALRAMTAGSVPEAELGIIGSLVVLGLLVAAAPHLPIWAGAAVAGGFALFHGHAHGAEMPEAASAALYAAGFVMTTAFLHGVGIALGLLLTEGRTRLLARFGGAGIAAAGVAFYILG